MVPAIGRQPPWNAVLPAGHKLNRP